MPGTQLETLPAEVLLRVFQYLDNIDDALHLGRSCRRLYQILDRPGHRYTIMRSIIIQSPYHRYDLQISHMSQFHAECMKIYADQPRLPTSSRPESTIIRKFRRLRLPTKELLSSPEVVFEIVCRWHAMKMLFDAYCDMSHGLDFCNSGYGSVQTRAMPQQSETKTPPLEMFLDFADFPAKEKKRAYQRFYRALMAHWKNVEFAWLARICRYESAEERFRIDDEVHDMWTCNPDRTLQEKLDIVEVVDFVWCWLVNQVIFRDRPCLLGWFEGVTEPPTPEDFSPLDLWLSHVNNDLQPRRYSAQLSDLTFLELCSDYFVEDVTQHLRPPHVIELLSLLAIPAKTSWKINRPQYVCELGVMDTTYAWEMEDEYEGPQRYTPDLVEEDALDDLASIGREVQEEQITKEIKEDGRSPDDEACPDSVNAECTEQWREYREKQWVSEMRRQILFRDESEKELFERIIKLETVYIYAE